MISLLQEIPQLKQVQHQTNSMNPRKVVLLGNMYPRHIAGFIGVAPPRIGIQVQIMRRSVSQVGRPISHINSGSQPQMECHHRVASDSLRMTLEYHFDTRHVHFNVMLLCLPAGWALADMTHPARAMLLWPKKTSRFTFKHPCLLPRATPLPFQWRGLSIKWHKSAIN